MNRIIVYPDGQTPPQGTGLNKPARVTLRNIYPKKSTVKFEQTLRKKCADFDAEFVRYDPELGLWVFDVKHFR